MSRNKPTKLEVAIEDLKSYFGILTQSDLFSTMISATPSKAAEDLKKTQFANLTSPKKKGNEGGIAKIMSKLQSQQAGFFAHEIISEMKNYISGDHSEAKAKELNKFFTVVYEDSDKEFSSFAPNENPGTKTSLNALSWAIKAKEHPEDIKEHKNKKVNEAKSKPTKEKPALSAFVVHSNKLNPSKRNSSSPELFLNTIPNIEMSRCVPYLDVTVIPSTPSLDEKGRKQTLSLLQFLEGNTKTSRASDKTIASSYDLKVRKNIFNNKSDAKQENRATAAAGMEIFTSPQTLVNGDESYFQMSGGAANRSAPVIDKFRPFMSIKSFKVNLAPSAGLITFKTADINIILHDRSRLGEISELIKPDMYGRTELLITYGWSHPDGNLPGNVYGRFLDQLKCTEKYGIVNCQYTFDAVGQVNITIKLSLKGTPSLDLTDITSDSASDQALKGIDQLTAAVKAARKKLSGKSKKGSKSVSGSSVLGKLSDTSSAMRFNDETEKKIKEFIKKAKSSKSPDVKELVSALKKLKKELPAARKAISDIAGKKVLALTQNRYWEKDTFDGTPKKPAPNHDDPAAADAISDPFLISFSGHNGSTKYVNIDEDDFNYVSFGSLLMQFVGYPLARSGQFDEVQFIFYSFNKYASYVRNQPISSFPIYIPDFEKEFKEASKTTTKMSLNRFLKFVDKKFISTQTSRAYGLRDALYEKDKKTKKMKLKEMYKDATLLKGEKDMRLEDAYGKDTSPLRFKVPRIQMHAECLDGPTSENTIYRVHIFDANSSSHSTFAQILKASEDSSLEALTSNIGKAAGKSRKDKKKDKAKAVEEFREEFIEQINLALKNKVLEIIPKETGKDQIEKSDLDAVGNTIHFRVASDFTKVKNMLIQNMPSIIYGTSNTNITQANLGSLNSPALTNIHMRRSGMGSGNTPLGLRDSGLPLQVAPMRLQVQSLGCPLITIGQQYFIDFGTGTSVDNIYVVSKVRHEISAGKFTSSIDFHPLNAYGQYTNVGNIVDQAIAELNS